MIIRTNVLRAFIVILSGLCLFLQGCAGRAVRAPVETVSFSVIAPGPAPILSTPDFRRVFGGRDGHSLHRDHVGLVREVESVALPGTVFRVDGVAHRRYGDVYRVTTRDYPFPSKNGLFVYSGFVSPCADDTPDRVAVPPHPVIVRCRLLSALGRKYIWGGDWRDGIPRMLEFFAPTAPVSPEERTIWCLRGVDCSGLLYQAANGFTPRNASALVRFGKAVEIAGLTAAEIADRLKPLDIIVWHTHVVIVLDKDRVIQSQVSGFGGVHTDRLLPYLERLTSHRIPVDDYDDHAGDDRFVVRRWYPTEKI